MRPHSETLLPLGDGQGRGVEQSPPPVPVPTQVRTPSSPMTRVVPGPHSPPPSRNRVFSHWLVTVLYRVPGPHWTLGSLADAVQTSFISTVLAPHSTVLQPAAPATMAARPAILMLCLEVH